MKKQGPFWLRFQGLSNILFIKNESKYTPEGVLSLGVEIFFKDNKALNVFMHHPKHYEATAIFEKYLADPPYMVLTYESESIF